MIWVTILMLGLAIGTFSIVLYLIIGDVWGAPFVPTPAENIEEIMRLLEIKKEDVFFDLGSGEGRIVIQAAKRFGVDSVGVEINPWLVLWAKINARLKGAKTARFDCKSFWGVDLRPAKKIYMYLIPRSAKKIKKKVEEECRKGTILVSRSFEIPDWKEHWVKTARINGSPFYVYKV